MTKRARALNDLKSIGRFTLKTWGHEQRNIYLSKLDESFLWDIFERKTKGAGNDDLKPVNVRAALLNIIDSANDDTAVTEFLSLKRIFEIQGIPYDEIFNTMKKTFMIFSKL